MKKLYLLLAAVLLLSLVAAPSTSAQEGGSVEELIRGALRSFNYGGVLSTAREMARMGARAPGYPGYYSVFDMLRGELERLGLNVTVQEFTMLAPVETETGVEVLGPERVVLRAYSLWPNGGLAAGEGVKEGPLVYAGRGTLEDFNGKRVNGSIVVLEYNSGDGWVSAMRFGAKAVVLLAPVETDRYETFTKFDPLVPVPFMRLYLPPDESQRLRRILEEGEVEARVFTDMRLREVKAYNILAEVPGTASGNEIIVFAAHFDAWSVAPGLSNSTEEALAAATLLELARYLAQNKPARTVWLLFTSGHWNGLTGPREFVRNRILADPTLTSGSRVIWYVVGMDFTADFPGVSTPYVGYFYAVGRPFMTTKFFWVQGRISSVYQVLVREYLNETGLPSSTSLRSAMYSLNGPIRFQDLIHGPDYAWTGTQAWPYVLDTEPFVMAGMAAFTLKTIFGFKVLEGAPVSDLGYVEERFGDRVVPQVASAVAVAVGLANEPEVRVMKSLVLPTRLHSMLYWGFIDLEARILEYNISKGWYDPVPEAIVRISRFSDYPFAWMFVKADSRGVAEAYGLTPQGLNSWLVEAYKPVNETFMYVPAYGMHSSGVAWLNALVPRVYATVNVKPLQVRVLLDIYYPRIMRRCALLDPRFGSMDTWVFTSVSTTPYQTETGMIPVYFGSVLYAQTDKALVASSPVDSMTITVRYVERWPLVVVGGYKNVLSAMDYAYTLYRLASSRYDVLSAREVRKLSAEVMLDYSREHVEAMKKALAEDRYGDAYRHALAAWSYTSRAYADESMPLYDESVRSALVFVPFVVISGFFFERLLIRAEGLRRVIAIVALEVGLMALFALTHPAFWVIPSTLLAAMSIGILILMAAVLWVFYREARDIAAEYAAKMLGFHEVVRERMAATLMAVSLSTENMRRRPLRTILTIVPVTVFAMALLSLASISPYTAVLSQPVEGVEAPYYGIVLKRGFSVLGDSLDYPAVIEAQAIVGERGVVVPRIWYYPSLVYPMGPYGLLMSFKEGVGGNATVRVTAVLGLSPEEADLLVTRGLVRGLPKPFFDEYQNAVVLSSDLAEVLGVDLGDEVEFMGLRLVVTGIVSGTAMTGIRDLDGGQLSPIDPLFYGQLYGYFVSLGGALRPTPLAWSRVIIVPSGVARKMGGYVSSIAVILKENVTWSEAEEITQRLVYAIDMRGYLGKGGKVYTFSRFPSYAAIGWEMMVIPLVITSLSIVTSLLGSVKEREREIFTYSSVGLSPVGAMLMFIMEFAVYGFIGATVGYFAGWVTSKALRTLGVLPPAFVFNYASISISMIMVLVLASTLLAAAYPSQLAARIITPSLERKWKIPRAPRGTMWDIPMPFRVPSEEEALGLLLYLREYYMGAGYEKRFFKVSMDPRVDVDGKKMVFAVRLYPYDAGTEQEVNVYMVKERIGGYRLSISLRLLKGAGGVWRGPSQYNFIDDLRKQALLWGTLPSSERSKYIGEARRIKRQATGAS